MEKKINNDISTGQESISYPSIKPIQQQQINDGRNLHNKISTVAKQKLEKILGLII
jgi:hypothetical protein